MEKIPKATARAEFETLLGRLLWNDLDRYGKRRLLLLILASEDFAREFQEACELDTQLLSATPANSALAAAASARRSHFQESASRRRGGARRGPWQWALAALVFGAMALGLWLSRQSIETLFRPQTTVAFGEYCRRENGIRPGPLLAGNYAGWMIGNASPSHFCELRLASGYVLVRLFPGALSRIYQSEGRIQLRLEEGRLLAIGLRSGADREFELYSGAARVRLIGTRVYLSRTNHHLQVSVLEGRASLQQDPLFLAPPAGQASLREALAQPTSTESLQTIADGQSVSIEEDATQLAKARQALLRAPQGDAAADPGNSSPDRAQLQSWRQSLSAEELRALQGLNSDSRVVQLDAGHSRLLQSLSEAAEITESQHRELGEAQESSLPRHRARTAAGSPHRILLVDGRILYGRAVQEGESLRVFDASGGVQSIPLSQVRSVESQ
ncbi:MAG: FecR family protein [Leptospirales bacterium]|nr:FecR family protein [Leptospirales bacterium]